MPIEDRLTRGPAPPPGVLLTGAVRVAPGSLTDSFKVTVPSFDPTGPYVYEIARWMPRGEALPKKGDEVLVAIDEEGEAWGIAWWPA